jgi:hypothetical protein
MVVPAFPVLPNSGNAGNGLAAPLPEALFVLSVLTFLRHRLIGARDLIIDSTPILAWRRVGPDAAVGHAPAQHPRPLLTLPYDDVTVPASS